MSGQTEIIEIDNPRKLPKNQEFLTCCACVSPEEAIMSYKKRFGTHPKQAWVYQQPSGRSTVYCGGD